MLVKDEQKSKEHAVVAAREAYRDKLEGWVKEQLKHAVYVRDNDHSPTNLVRQMGRSMSATQVETLLKKLCPRLHFLENPNNLTKKAMYEQFPDGSLKLIMSYESGTIPEFSVMQPVLYETVDPGVFDPKHVTARYDLTKHEIRPHEFDEQGNLKRLGGVEFDDTVPLLGMKREIIPWREAIRGWRTMLTILVHSGHITIPDIQRIFGDSSRREWAIKIGKHAKSSGEGSW